MTSALRIGDPVQVHAETEVLTLISVDGADAWCRDGAGGHVQYRLEDLERARSKAHAEITGATAMRYYSWPLGHVLRLGR